jgi:hypothetical protein
MDTFIKSMTKKYAVLSAIFAQALVLLPSSAFAQSPVTVTNGPTMPVPVTGTLNVNPATQVLNPYQQEGSISDSSKCAPQCIINFPVVPVGRRLVLTNASAQLGSNIDIFVIEGNGVAFFVPKAYPTAGYLAQPITVYFEPGSTPTARFFVPDATQHTSLIVTFTGYFVPLQ